MHIDLLRQNAPEVPGAATFLRNVDLLMPNRQAIGSGARHDEIDVFLRQHKLGEIVPVERRVARGDYTQSKPHPECFEVAFGRLKLPDSYKTRTLVVEDDPKGIEAGIVGGFVVAGLTTRFTEKELMNAKYQPNIVAADMHDLARLLGLPTAPAASTAAPA